MSNQMKQDLNDLLMKFMSEQDCEFDSGFNQHLVDQMVDAVEIVYVVAVKMHAYLMGVK